MDITSIDFLLSLKASVKKANDLGAPIYAPEIKKSIAFADGNGANQAKIIWGDTRTVNGGANDDIDLAGVLTDAFGDVVTAVEMVGLIIVTPSTNTSHLVVGAGSNPWITMWIATGDGIKVFPGGAFCNIAPDASGLGAVTAATADILRINNPGGAACDYTIGIIARTA